LVRGQKLETTMKNQALSSAVALKASLGEILINKGQFTALNAGILPPKSTDPRSGEGRKLNSNRRKN